MISIEAQLSIFLDNRPGALARTCQALAKERINILAMSISDTVDDAVVRLVVSDAKKAANILRAMQIAAHERQVIFMDVPNAPGSLARIAEQLAEAGINIEYAYCTGSASQPNGNLVLRTNDLEATINALS